MTPGFGRGSTAEEGKAVKNRIVSEADIGTRTVDGVQYTVTRSVWSDGGLSYDVTQPDGELLTMEWSFDAEPTDDQIRKLLNAAAEDDHEHSEGDGCAVYLAGYRVIERERGEIDVEDLEPGDFYRDEAYEPEGEWLAVTDVAIVDGDVHVESGEDEECE